MQLIEIARALNSEFRVLILDEPTAALSERETEVLFKAIKALRSGMALPLRVNWYSVTRSMRCSGKPQLRAMSVALDAQGETVPKRGLTTQLGCAVAGGPPSTAGAAEVPRTCAFAWSAPSKPVPGAKASTSCSLCGVTPSAASRTCSH
jgi:hypothetical protein